MFECLVAREAWCSFDRSHVFRSRMNGWMRDKNSNSERVGAPTSIVSVARGIFFRAAAAHVRAPACAFTSCCSSLSLLSRARFCSSALPCATLVDGCTCAPVVRATCSLIRPPIFSVFLVVLASTTKRSGLPEERRDNLVPTRASGSHTWARYARTLVHTYEHPSATHVAYRTRALLLSILSSMS